MERYEICLGGTFSPVHAGHLHLLRTAFSLAKAVRVGLTSDAFASSTRKRRVQPYAERERQLRVHLDRLSSEHGVPYTVRMISDASGFASDPDLEAIVASKRTEPTLDGIDAERAKLGLPPLRRFIVDMMLDDHGSEISSTRIEMGAIDTDGRRKGDG